MLLHYDRPRRQATNVARWLPMLNPERPTSQRVSTHRMF